MAVKAFKFASPGIFLNEIDQSQVPQQPAEIGPIIIGRSLRGPVMRPVTVNSYDEFVQIFGEPVAGGNSSGDVWRSGTPAGPTYAPYAAQAWLANNSTATFVRLLGTQTSNPTTTSGYAGWTVGTPSATGMGGAYGLFIFPSSSNAGNLTGSLAAVWYSVNATPTLSGSIYGDSAQTKSTNGLMLESDSNGVFKVLVNGSGTDSNSVKSFNFDPSSDKFIRKVFNTNPQNCNTDTNTGLDTNGTSYYGYWLGETFENDIATNVYSGSTTYFDPANVNVASKKSVGIILPLNNFGSGRSQKFATDIYAARTGWIIAQGSSGPDTNYVAKNAQKLFRFVAVDAGDWIRDNLKVTINNILAPQNDAQKFGTFDVEVRSIKDTDSNKQLIESFTNCTLDPSSPNFIARRIGNTTYSWNETERSLNEVGQAGIGQYPNNSRYIRVEFFTDYDPNSSPANIPFGVLGPLVYTQVTASGASAFVSAGAGFIAGTASCNQSTSSNNFTSSAGPVGQNFAFRFPNLRYRYSSTEDSLTTYKIADWGASTTRTFGSSLYNDGVNDLLRLPVTNSTGFTNGVEGGGLSYAWTFSLDEVVMTGSSSGSSGFLNKFFTFSTGSKAGGTSYTALYGTYADLVNIESVNSFTTVFQGGIDGFNILEGEPLRNTAMSTSNASDDQSYVYYTYRRALDTVRDPEVVQANILCVPGLTYESLTLYATKLAEQRGDVLAIIDASGPSYNVPAYTSKYEKSDNAQSTTDRVASVSDIVARMKSRNLNTSYGATYYPWVQIADSMTGKVLPVPPSVVAIGAMSYTDAVQAPWFAPAGFNRGGLSTGNAGLNVVNVLKKLSSSDRDKLYPVNVNPIASFPNEGIVIFGQKTLQAIPSALDRINVRRLMLYIKRGINIISTSILFEPNVEDTWNNFKDKAEPFLADVKARYGLTDYKLILDSTTTTPDLIDQNIMYAKIYLKPAKSIEFIAVDFFITRSGASFNI